MDLGGGEPFVAHLIGYEVSATAALARGVRIDRARGNDGERAACENPVFHRVAQGIEGIVCPASRKIKSVLSQSERAALVQPVLRTILLRRIMQP